MAVILEKDLARGRQSYDAWRAAAYTMMTDARAAGGDDDATRDARLSIAPRLARPTTAMAVRYSLHLLERKAPGPGVEVRVAPWGAVKILDGPASDPHNLTPPDVIELDPDVWLRVATGVTTWAEEKDAGRISAVGERDDLGWLLPLEA
ncbi:sterol carrier family protein [Bifidobacterium stellenboschense]|nr:sterol carrier family protein [Bifidobacterium stellenboschense]